MCSRERPPPPFRDRCRYAGSERGFRDSSRVTGPVNGGGAESKPRTDTRVWGQTTAPHLYGPHPQVPFLLVSPGEAARGRSPLGICPSGPQFSHLYQGDSEPSPPSRQYGGGEVRWWTSEPWLMNVEWGWGLSGGRGTPGPPVCTQHCHPCLRSLAGHQERVLRARVFCNLHPSNNVGQVLCALLGSPPCHWAPWRLQQGALAAQP